MANMNIKGSRDVNWNTNYEIAIFVFFFCKMQEFSSNVFYVDNFNELNATVVS